MAKSTKADKPRYEIYVSGGDPVGIIDNSGDQPRLLSSDEVQRSAEARNLLELHLQLKEIGSQEETAANCWNTLFDVYLKVHSHVRKALDGLVRAGCDENIIRELIRDHCFFTPLNRGGMREWRKQLNRDLEGLDCDLEKLAERITRVNETFLRWIPELVTVNINGREYNFPKSDLETLPIILKVHSAVLKTTLGKVSRVLREAGDYFWELPILDAYIRNRTGDPHYPELSTILSVAPTPTGSPDDDVSPDGLRKVVERYRERNSQMATAIDRLVKQYFDSATAQDRGFLDRIYEQLGEIDRLDSNPLSPKSD